MRYDAKWEVGRSRVVCHVGGLGTAESPVLFEEQVEETDHACTDKNGRTHGGIAVSDVGGYTTECKQDNGRDVELSVHC